jgi:8-amino-7-oxononanoate synthase
LAARIASANRQITDRLQQATSGSQIIPILIGDNARAARVAATLQAQGFDIRAIRPPTVPAGTARLRISITMNTTMDDISRMASAVARAMSEVPA